MSFSKKTRDGKRENKHSGETRSLGANDSDPAQPDGEHPLAKLPHERDETAKKESLSDQDSREKIRRAQNDIDKGRADTDRRSAYGLSDGLPHRETLHLPHRKRT